MKLSLITVCLNSESTIADTIRSVLEQQNVELEHIVFDGGSTDQTIAIVKSYGEKIRLIEGRDAGIFDAMNQAIGYARGEIIGIINSDDFYAHRNVLSRVLERFESTNSDSVYGDMHYVEREAPDKVYRNWKSGEFDHSKFRYGWTVPHPTFFVRKKVYDRFGLFDPAFEISGDYELILRFLYKHQVSTSYLPEVLVKMRKGGASNGGVGKRLKSLREDYRSWRVNGLKPSFYTIPLKPIRKISQLIQSK